MMKFSNMIGILATAMIFSFSAIAQTSELKVAADLMIHPNQMAGFFNMATGKISGSEGWDWPALQFTKPYKTSWSNVQAVGPFNVHFSTDQLSQREFSFELDWANPSLKIGQFEIHDTIARSFGGVNVIINLDGRCENMAVQMPGGQWRVKGKMKWDWAAQRMVVSWVDFQFDMNAGAPSNVDLGQCQGAQGIQNALRETIESLTKDRAWLSDVLQQGVLEWVENSLGGLQGSLMQARVTPLKDDLVLSWQPATLIPQDKGMLRVAGTLSLIKNGVTVEGGDLARNYNDDLLSRVSSSGFILPRNTLQKVLEFAQRTGDLQYRVKSGDVEGFVGLMKSKMMQFFVWPDLMKFPATSQFYFDLGVSQPPLLGKASNTADGVTYAFTAPAVVHQWAPTATAYVPYVDFNSAMNGSFLASIKNGELILQVKPDKLKMGAAFRPEFLSLRSVTKRISTTMLDSRVQEYLNNHPFKVKLPDWQIGDGFSIGLSGLDQRSETLRIPLEFKNSK